MDINKLTANYSGFDQAKIEAEKESIKPDNRESNKDSDIRLSDENILNVVDTLNHAAKTVNKRVSFSYHEGSHRVIMKIQDETTNEVIREIPSRDMVRLLEHIHEMLGMFVDESG